MEENYNELDQRISRIESLLSVLILNEIEKKNTIIFSELSNRHPSGFFDKFWLNFKKYLGIEGDKSNYLERINLHLLKVEELFDEFKSSANKLPSSNK